MFYYFHRCISTMFTKLKNVLIARCLPNAERQLDPKTFICLDACITTAPTLSDFLLLGLCSSLQHLPFLREWIAAGGACLSQQHHYCLLMI